MCVGSILELRSGKEPTRKLYSRRLRVQCLPDRRGDLRLRQRFHGKCFDTRRAGDVGIDHAAETRAHDGGCIRSDRQDLFDELFTGYLGHDRPGKSMGSSLSL